MDFDLAKRAVITVGPGHGFVVAGPSETFHVITASHCLPYLPPAHPASPLEERTYANLLGHLGESPALKPFICDCLKRLGSLDALPTFKAVDDVFCLRSRILDCH